MSQATGLDSILWRYSWERNHAPSLKTRIIQYNKEDCLALRALSQFIASFPTGGDPGPSSEKVQRGSVVATSALRPSGSKRPLFRKAEFVFEELEFVNKCAYFDYQRDKVYVRAAKQFKEIKKRIHRLQNRPRRANTIVHIQCKECPNCKRKRSITPRQEISKTVIDLRVTKSGAKRWIVRYVTWRYRCLKCQNSFLPPDWPKSRAKYGHGLAAWCVYHNVARKQPMLQISAALHDVFYILAPDDHLYRFKTQIAKYYADTYRDILSALMGDPVAHMDETTVKIHNEKGYVWVIAGMNSVYYFYKASRKGSFLKELLGEFSGVLVSDFYTAYDSIDCPQQKCLIHLMRDLNDDLRMNPFDEELSELVHRFAVLLRAIVASVDKYRLKRRHLHKHEKHAMGFLNWASSQQFTLDIARKFRDRIGKAGRKLFTFLEYDGVPWNNNNAEHAMHWFAKYRRFSNGLFTERSLQEFLVILSILQTCEYNGVNGLKFLLSRETGLEGITGFKG